MFNLQGSELIIILLLALVVLGPEKLPDAMRKAGQFYAELKKMSSGFQEEFRSVVDEPLREMRDTANLLRDSADFTKLKSGERDEKPKSAEMVDAAELEVADPDAVPVDEVPFEPVPVPDDPSTQPPFSAVQISSAAPRPPSANATPSEPEDAASDPPDVASGSGAASSPGSEPPADEGAPDPLLPFPSIEFTGAPPSEPVHVTDEHAAAPPEDDAAPPADANDDAAGRGDEERVD